MGTPDFALKSLEALYNTENEIVGVVTNQDKPKGRGMQNVASPVKEFALEKNLKLFQPIKVRKNEEFINEIKSLNPDLLCVVAYGKILPKELLSLPKFGAINVHGSLLPKYRGAAPIQWAVLNGDKETGITTMFMDEGMDTGDMILKEKVQIGDEETTGELWDRLSDIGAKLLVQTVSKIEEISKEIESKSKENEEEAEKSLEDSNDVEKMEEVPNDIENKLEGSNLAEVEKQKEEIMKKLKEKIGAKKQGEDFTLAPMLDKEMALIDWSLSAEKIKNLVRGLNPIMGAYTFLNGKKIKIWKVRKIEDNNQYEDKKSGDIILPNKKELIVKTGEGLIEILEIQGENSKKMDTQSFLNGNKIEEGAYFSNNI